MAPTLTSSDIEEVIRKSGPVASRSDWCRALGWSYRRFRTHIDINNLPFAKFGNPRNADQIYERLERVRMCARLLGLSEREINLQFGDETLTFSEQWLQPYTQEHKELFLSMEWARKSIANQRAVTLTQQALESVTPA